MVFAAKDDGPTGHRQSLETVWTVCLRPCPMALQAGVAHLHNPIHPHLLTPLLHH